MNGNADRILTCIDNADVPAIQTQVPTRICYIFSPDYIKCCDQLPKVSKRATLTHALIEAYDIIKHMKLVSPRSANDEELSLFHSKDYIECLRTLSECEDEEKYDEDAEVFGLTYDCPAFPGVFEYAKFVVGATMKAAQCLMMDVADVAINWPGGWHHAKRDEASGFCYFNDIVVAILYLRKKFERVLYIDLDLHHGDGVEDAFCSTDKVMTVSFHKTSPGFFPGTGYMDDIGIGRGKYYSINVPLEDGITDEQFINTVTTVLSDVKTTYSPQAVVCQCGADGLAGDPMQSFNLTAKALVDSVSYIHKWGLPLLLVGGGGYHMANTARCWAQITAAVTGCPLSSDIPEHQYFPQYGPDYQLEIEPGNRANKNTTEEIESVLSSVNENLQRISN